MKYKYPNDSVNIIQSFWSKPYFEKLQNPTDAKYTVGWLDSRHFFMCWAYSCLQLQKYHGSVTLYTDRRGKELLVDLLGIPYDNIVVCLNDVDVYDRDLWAIGKVYTYSLQNEPFIHVDGDLIVYEPLNTANNGVLFLHYEVNRPFYKDYMMEIYDKFNFIPPVFDQIRNRNEYMALNAGILGGSDIDFIKQYSGGAIEFVDKNQHVFESFSNVKNLNIIFEQLFLYYLAGENRRTSYLPVERTRYSSFADAPSNTKLVHARNGFRQEDAVGLQLEFRFKKEYPEYHSRISALASSFKI